jgi:Homeobox KN domain
MNSNKKSTSLPNETVEYLKAWMMSPEHIAHPYPTDAEKSKIMKDTGIELKQLTNWFVNNRKRYWKPRVEAKLHEHQPQGNIPTVVTSAGTTKQKTCTSATKLPRSVSMLLADIAPDSVPNGLDTSIVNTLQVASDSLSAKFKRSSENGSSSSSDLSNMTEGSVTTSRSVQHKQLSAVSPMDSVYVSQNNSDDEDSQEQVKTELLDVHILRPTGDRTHVEISDVSILPFFPKERVARTFKNCLISYDVSVDIDPTAVSNEKLIEMISSRRESKMMAMKHQCLAAYLAECETNAVSFDVTIDVPELEASKRKHPHPAVDDFSASVVAKCRRVSVDMESRYGKDELPTIEEAAQLFGFAQAIQQHTVWSQISP